MSYQFTLSDIGLRLIKAYEGYAPDGRRTRDGRKIIGYGRIASESDEAVTESDAEAMLKSDLSGIESLINTHVHAALTQSQFDALCSLAHSIGPDAFLNSDVLHAMNRGEVITAANGFDSWRLGNIDGQIYVVDALVRRRTAEKALFLRPTLRTVPAPHETLRAFQDDAQVSEYVAPTPQQGRAKPASTKIVSLYEQAQTGDPSANDRENDNASEDEIIELTDRVDDSVEEKHYTSPIAEAAAEVSERLDALMEKDAETDSNDWPKSLANPQTSNTATDEDTSISDVTETPAAIVIDYLDADDALRESIQDNEYSSADRYIQPARASNRQNLWAYITMITLGLAAASAGLWISMNGSKSIIGEMGPLFASSAVAVGVVLLIMGLYYFMKSIFNRH